MPNATLVVFLLLPGCTEWIDLDFARTRDDDLHAPRSTRPLVTTAPALTGSHREHWKPLKDKEHDRSERRWVPGHP